MSKADNLIRQTARIAAAVPAPVEGKPLNFTPEEHRQIEEIWEAVGGAGDDDLEGIYAVRAMLRRCDEDQLDIMHKILESATRRGEAKWQN